MKAVRSDHGSELTSHGFVDFCSGSGIRRELANVGTPSENGVVEWKNRTVVEMARAMLEHRSLPRFLWAEAVASAVHILNRAPTSAAVPHQTPYQAYFGRKPSVSPCASLVVMLMLMYQRRTDPSLMRSLASSFLWVITLSASYRLYDLEHRRLEHSRDVIFDESSVLEGVSSLPSEEDTTHEPTVSVDSDDVPAVSDPLPLLPRSSHLMPIPPISSS